jgi:hypothetical protein
MKLHSVVHFIFLVSTVFSIALLFTGCADDQDSQPLQLSDYPEHESAEAKLYISKCSGCHAAPLPKIHVAEQWPGVVQRMEMRMNNKAIKPPSSQETELIVGYLQKHASK